MIATTTTTTTIIIIIIIIVIVIVIVIVITILILIIIIIIIIIINHVKERHLHVHPSWQLFGKPSMGAVVFSIAVHGFKTGCQTAKTRMASKIGNELGDNLNIPADIVGLVLHGVLNHLRCLGCSCRRHKSFPTWRAWIWQR